MVSYGKILRADKLKRTNERTNERTRKKWQRAACKVLHMLQLLSHTDIEFYVLYILFLSFVAARCHFFSRSFTNVYLFSFVCIFGLVSHKLNSVAGEKKKRRQQKNTSNQNVCDSQQIHSFDSVRLAYECESGGGFHSDMFVTF